MASNVKDAVVEEVTETENLLANPKGKTVEELMEIAKVLQVQVNNANTKASQYQALWNTEIKTRTKAEGALEVILQLIPQNKVQEMIDDLKGPEETEEEEKGEN